MSFPFHWTPEQKPLRGPLLSMGGQGQRPWGDMGRGLGPPGYWPSEGTRALSPLWSRGLVWRLQKLDPTCLDLVTPDP